MPLTPAELEPLVASDEFKALSPGDRGTVLNGALREAHQWVSQNGGWTPEKFQSFGNIATGLRETALDKSSGEHVGGAFKTIGGVIKDSAATLATTAVSGFVPEKASDFLGYGLPRPGSQVVEAFKTNMQKLGKSVQAAFSTGDDILGNELTVLKQDIDAGRVPEDVNGWSDWLDQRNDRLKQAQTQAYTRLEGDTPENRAFAESNSLLGNARHGALLLDYLQTRDPAVFDELRKNVSMTPGRAKLEDKQERIAKDSNLAKMMNSAFGEGAGNYIIEAGDPLEVAGNLLPLVKGAKLVKAIKSGSKLKAAGEAVIGAAGETASELGSQFMDDPTASWEQRLQVAKDAFIGSLGLGGLGAGAQMVRDRFVPPPVDAANPPAAASAERKPSDDLPPQRWTPRGQTMADMPPGAELTYDDQGRVSGWEAPVAGTAPAAVHPGPVSGASLLAQVAARGGQYDAPLSPSPNLPGSESPTLQTDLDSMPETGAEIVYDDDGSLMGWVPATPSPISPSGRVLTPESDPVTAALAAQAAAMPDGITAALPASPVNQPSAGVPPPLPAFTDAATPAPQPDIRVAAGADALTAPLAPAATADSSQAAAKKDKDDWSPPVALLEATLRSDRPEWDSDSSKEWLTDKIQPVVLRLNELNGISGDRELTSEENSEWNRLEDKWDHWLRVEWRRRKFYSVEVAIRVWEGMKSSC